MLRYRAAPIVNVAKTARVAAEGEVPKKSPRVTSHVIYTNRDGAVNMTGDSMTHWQMFRAGQFMPPQPADLAPAKKSKSWTERTREKLLSRDGTDCHFCGKTMIGHDHTGRALAPIDRNGTIIEPNDITGVCRSL